MADRPGFDGAPGSGGATGTGSGGAAAGTGGSGTGGSATGGSSGTGGSTGSGGAGGAASTCDIRVAELTPRPLAGPSAIMRVQATLAVATNRAPTWTWQVRGPMGDLVSFAVLDGDSDTIEFVVAKKGSYTLSVATVLAGVTCSRFYPLAIAEPCPGCFQFRFTPPVSDDVDVPTQNVLVNVAASPNPTVKLKGGSRVSIAPVDVNEQRVTGYVQLVAVESGLSVDGYTGQGPMLVNWSDETTYEVLVIPERPKLPPQLFSPATPLTRFVVDNGWFLTGSASDGQGGAVAGANVLLRAGRRPTSVGNSNRGGQFNLLVRPGVVSAFVSPPPNSGLPELTLKPGERLNLDADWRHLKIEWAPATRAPLAVTVTGGPDAAPIAGARVRAETEGEIAAAASVGLFATSEDPAPLQTLTATGRVWADTTTDASGVARFAALPPGTYRLTVVPPANVSAATLTTIPFVKVEGEQRATVSMASPVQLVAMVGPLPDSAGARVVARDLGTGLIADESAGTVGPDGTVTLSVAPNRSYRVVAEPIRGRGLARTVLAASLTSGRGPEPTMLAPMTIARGRTFTLTAWSDDRPVAGAAVQVFCVPQATGCVVPDVAMAEAVTGAAGTFSVVLPVAEP